MKKKYVLDSSAIMSGKSFIEAEKFYTVQGVADEVKSSDARVRLDVLLEAGLTVSEPEGYAIDKVRDAAKRTGDYHKLSAVDLALISLAQQIGGTMVSDDYAIQNTCEELGIEHRAITADGITHKISWQFKCSGCKKTFETPKTECPVCGSKVETKRKSREKI